MLAKSFLTGSSLGATEGITFATGSGFSSGAGADADAFFVALVEVEADFFSRVCPDGFAESIGAIVSIRQMSSSIYLRLIGEHCSMRLEGSCRHSCLSSVHS